MNKKLARTLALILLIGIGAWFAYKKSSQSVEQTHSTNSSTTSSETSQNTDDYDILIIGNPKSPVKIIEFADYKCPTCNNFHRTIEPQIKKDYINTDKAHIEIRTLPYIGLDARPAAEGAYCALDQDKFEPYHGSAFSFVWENYYSKGGDESDNIFTDANLSTIAKTAGLDVSKFDKCVSAKTFTNLVDRDLKSSQELQATGTPTFLIGDQRVVGAQPYAVFRALIEQQL